MKHFTSIQIGKREYGYRVKGYTYGWTMKDYMVEDILELIDQSEEMTRSDLQGAVQVLVEKYL